MSVKGRGERKETERRQLQHGGGQNQAVSQVGQVGRPMSICLSVVERLIQPNCLPGYLNTVEITQQKCMMFVWKCPLHTLAD